MKLQIRALCWLLSLAVMASAGASYGTHRTGGEAEVSILSFQRQIDQMITEAPETRSADVRDLQHTLTEAIHPEEHPEEQDPSPQSDAILLIPQRFFLSPILRIVVPAPRHIESVVYRRQEQRPLRPPGTRLLYEFHLLSNAPPTGLEVSNVKITTKTT